MERYTLDQSRIPELGKKTNRMVLQFLLIMVPVGVAIVVHESDDLRSAMPPFIITLVLNFIIFKNALKKQQDVLSSFTLIIDTDTLTREQRSLPTISINKSEITSIVKTVEGAFSINTKNKSDMIAVPYIVSGASELEKQLELIMPITLLERPPLLQRYMLVFLALFAGVTYCAFRAENIFLQACSALAIASIAIWTLVKLRKSKLLDKKVRSGLWMVMVPVGAAVFIAVYRLYMHFRH